MTETTLLQSGTGHKAILARGWALAGCTAWWADQPINHTVYSHKLYYEKKHGHGNVRLHPCAKAKRVLITM